MSLEKKVRSALASVARCCLIALLVVGLLDLPVSPAFAAAGESALGVVIQSQIANLGDSRVAIGTSVYSGDVLSTDIGGTLRLKIGAAQVYLLSSSAFTLGQEDGAVEATLARGTAGFSATPSDKLELVIPQGVLRAAKGQLGYGQVTIISPTEAIVSAYRGALVLDNAGDEHMIAAGSSYRVTILPGDDAQKPEGAGTQEYPEAKIQYAKHRNRKRLLFALILLGAAGLTSYFTYVELTESPSKFGP